jgi:integrase
MPDTQPARKESKRIHFTKGKLDKLAIPAQGRVTYYDSRSHLGLRIDDRGIKSFFWFRTGPQGKPIFRSLGTHPATRIETARKTANELQGKLEGWRAKDYAGNDPFADVEADPTFQNLLDRYIAKRVMGHAARPEHARKAVEWTVKKYLSDWTGKPLGRITDKDVRARHLKIAEESGKVMADRAIQLVRRLFRWGIEREKMFQGTNPARGVEYYGHDSRSRILGEGNKPEEIAKFFHELGKEKESNRDLADFIWLALATEARRSDILSMRWKDIDAKGVWTVPFPKGGYRRSYKQLLIPEALDILKARRELVPAGSHWVFPSTQGSSGHLVEVKRSWHQFLKRCGIVNFRIHDLRHCLPSIQADMGFSMPIIGKSLGHKAGSPATAVYVNRGEEAPRAAMSAAMTKLKADAATEAKKLGLSA